jgi:hypothetical protein
VGCDRDPAQLVADRVKELPSILIPVPSWERLGEVAGLWKTIFKILNPAPKGRQRVEIKVYSAKVL